jgi:hypothetical protein
VVVVKEEKGNGPGNEGYALCARFSKDLGLFINLTMHGDRVASVGSRKSPIDSYSRIIPTRIIDHRDREG